MTPEALRSLARDPVMAALIRAAGPCTIRPERGRSPYEALISAIAHQQLHGKAAQTILGRLKALHSHGGYPTPVEMLALPDAALRGVGFSNAKTLALKDLAAKALDGTVPARRSLARLSDEVIIERLTAVRGVGRWTVEMFLMFTLARPDVLPVDDFGVREGFRIAYRKRQQPKPKVLAAFGERWAPYRTTAAWYLYRAVDLDRASRQAAGAGR